ncbi:MAG: hypothetical protein GF364_13885, partial [Candidatus Lokiarchaeota archaeon]|nr:hypothetical protein [Candidatus Lokiarchaeota archaeon]
MLYLILTESALELIPKAIRKHPSVKKNIKKYGNIAKILDMSFHHSSLKNLRNYQSRGRPDIVHKFILDSLGSVINKLNLLRIYVHTRKSKIFEINPIMRPPRDYNRFKGLIYKLLTKEIIKVPESKFIDKKTLLFNHNMFESDDDPMFKQQLEKIGHYAPYRPNELNQFENSQRVNGPPFQFLQLAHFHEFENIILMRKMKKSLGQLVK